MIKLFLKNILLNNLLLIPYIIILRLRSFTNPPNYDEIIGLSPVLDTIYTNLHPFVLSILAVLVIFLQANLVNFFVNSNKLNPKNSLLAGMILSLGMCLLPHFLVLHPIMIANTFLILMLIQLSNIYKVYKPIKSMFMAGFFCGLTFLVSPHFIVLSLFIVQAILMLRDINLKEFLQSVIGVMIPIFIFGAFSLDRTKEGFLPFLQFDFNLPSFPSSFEPIDWIGLSVLILSILFLIFNQTNLRKKKSVKAQLLSSLLYFLLFYTIPMMLFKTALVPQHLTTVVVPLSILFTMLLFATKRLALAEFIHFALVIFIILFQFDIIL